ncbi:unnamed protein product [Prorocentrum cordatum]|uniref:Uncharacterized protein n=1 Tax=Prorocentrum cordatum TaxID=2364126 RepID=A0ABN9XTV6_9DINO|nr:unnamed protein product [Polarella glacialis]
MGGELSGFAVLDCGPRKLLRVARAAEVQEAGDAGGEQCMVRLVLAEVIRDMSPLRGRATALRGVPAVLVTDCRAFFDGALALRNALDEGQTTARWVHSHAHIADGFIEASWQAFGVIWASLEKQQWRLMCDEQFMSARRRAALGKGVFDATNPGDTATVRWVLGERRLARQGQSTDGLLGHAQSETNASAPAISDYQIMI